MTTGCFDNPSAHDTLFRSFWMGGYEGADHRNSRGVSVEPNVVNGHATRHDEDYAALRALGIRTIRESIGWRASTDAHGAPDTARIGAIAEAAQRHGLQVIWTLHHYGLPEGVDLFDPAMPAAFAVFCDAVSRVLSQCCDAPRIYQPVNEISFLAWAATHSTLMHPYRGDREHEAHALKRNLVRMTLAGCDALWANDPGARIVHTDPVIHVTAAPDDAEGLDTAARMMAAQYDAWDMIAGLRDHDLGGAPRYLDLIGLNYYHTNQWQMPDESRLHWHQRDPRRVPLDDLLALVHARYGRPVFLAETSHFGMGRAAWLDEIGDAALRCRARGIPLVGVCLYPLIDRPDWEDATHWHDSGLWSIRQRRGDPLTHAQRVLHAPYAARLHEWQRRIGAPAGTADDVVPRARDDPAPRLVASSSHSANQAGPSMPHLVVFSHLRWDFVYQRPQHLLSRVAAHFPVVFVEEPISDAPRDLCETLHPVAGVTVLRPHLRGTAHGFHDDHIPQLREMVDDHLREHGVDRYWLWFYTPMAVPFAAELAPVGIVYDCMDELSAFRNAPRQLVQRENALLKVADLVFTGGRSLHESKRERHPQVHCFPSSVDAAHFARTRGDEAKDPATEHPAQAAIPHPRLGYFGVIDERIDLTLIAALADAHPEWQIVMVGPVAKIDADALPRRGNIHWLGLRSYDDLPDLVAGWDVCLLPFALNEATRYISPTKTLEYLAADRPAVSTPIHDVVEPYGHVVAIAATHDTFVAACEAALTRSPEERALDSRARAAVVRDTSWDRTATEMLGLMTDLEAQKRTAVSSVSAASLAGSQPGRDEQARAYPTVILGAGPTGLSAALTAGADSVLIEKNPTIGGWCRSIEDGGFTFDHAGHIMFSTDPWVLELYERLLGDNLHWQNREAWVYSHSVYTRYPFQAALFGLPAPVLQECLIGAIEARFGPIGKPAVALSTTGPSRAAVAETRVAETRASTSDGASTMHRPTQPTVPAVPRNFEEFIYNVWGKGVAKHFAIPYNRKLWAVPLSEMETSWLGGRVPLPDLEEMIAGALAPVAKPLGPNARFGYPLKGGFQALMDGFLPLLEGDVELDAQVVAVSPSARTVTLADGREFGFKTLVSTIALPRLIEAIGAEAPPFIREAAAGLRHVSVRCVNLGIGRAALTEKHWIYYPEDTVFHRIFVQGNTSPHCNPPGGFGLTCEITYGPDKPLLEDGPALIERCIADCIRVGLFTADDPVWVANQVDMPYAYVVYDHTRAARVATIREWLSRSGIVLAGRYSEWEYYNSDHAFVAGRKAGETAARLNHDGALDDDRAEGAASAAANAG